MKKNPNNKKPFLEIHPWTKKYHLKYLPTRIKDFFYFVPRLGLVLLALLGPFHNCREKRKISVLKWCMDVHIYVTFSLNYILD